METKIMLAEKHYVLPSIVSRYSIYLHFLHPLKSTSSGKSDMFSQSKKPEDGNRTKIVYHIWN